MQYVRRFFRHWPTLLVYALLVLVLLITDPYNAPLTIVILPFGLLFLALFITFYRLLGLKSISGRFSSKKRLVIAAGAAWLPVMLLILRSINQLTGRDALILAIFIGAFLLYITRVQFRASH